MYTYVGISIFLSLSLSISSMGVIMKYESTCSRVDLMLLQDGAALKGLGLHVMELSVFES